MPRYERVTRPPFVTARGAWGDVRYPGAKLLAMRKPVRPAPSSSFTYLLRCGDGTFYAGYTRDPARRLRAHRQGRAARYTRGRGPWELAVLWRCRSTRDALRLEYLLKRLGRAARLRLVRGVPLSRVIPAAVGLGARRVRSAALVL